MTDGFPLLADFRSEVPEPDDDTARRIYRLATAPRSRSRRLYRLLPRSRRLVVVAGVVGLVAIPTAVAVGGRVVDLFTGTPAPPVVSSNFLAFNRMADRATQVGFAAKQPHADVARAHGVVEIGTADGPEDLWIAPSDQGGRCWFVDFADDRPTTDGQPGFGGCDPTATPASEINWGAVWTLRHPSLTTIFGHVYVSAASVHITLADGSTASLPIVEGMFLGTFDNGAKVTQLEALNENGDEVARASTPSP